MISKLLSTVLLLGSLTCGVTQAAALRFQISDPVNDMFNGGAIDLTGMILDFDSVTGGYTITVQARDTNPFLGNFRLNLYFLNPDTALGLSSGAILSDNLNDFNFAVPSTSIVLTGVSSVLTLWEIGDRVAINSVPFGVPGDFGLAFNSGTGGDIFGTPGGGAGARNFSTITAAPVTTVPEPGTGLLFGASAFLLAAGARLARRRRAA